MQFDDFSVGILDSQFFWLGALWQNCSMYKLILVPESWKVSQELQNALYFWACHLTSASVSRTSYVLKLVRVEIIPNSTEGNNTV
jgi:hypothetical protein